MGPVFIIIDLCPCVFMCLRAVANSATAVLVLCLTLSASRAVAAETSGATLRNDKVAYHWAPAGQGSGLIEDRERLAGLLGPTAAAAPWWRVKLKDGRIIANTDLPCQVDAQAEAVTFTWTGDIRVTVTARLGTDEQLLKARIRVDTVTEGIGLRDVVFPVIDGIRPLAENAADDRVLFTFRTGYTRPSPLVTGEPRKMNYCIEYHMQLAALLGGGGGLYFGDHDPTAASKAFSWTPDAETQRLSYAVSHPVLGWGGSRSAASGSTAASAKSPARLAFPTRGRRPQY